MNTKRENIRDGRPIVFTFSFMTDKTKLILALMTNSLRSKLFRTKKQPSRVGFLCAPSPTPSPHRPLLSCHSANSAKNIKSTKLTKL